MALSSQLLLSFSFSRFFLLLQTHFKDRFAKIKKPTRCEWAESFFLDPLTETPPAT
jgi:hypothetical protein